MFVFSLKIWLKDIKNSLSIFELIPYTMGVFRRSAV